jgi:hypothetical protein
MIFTIVDNIGYLKSMTNVLVNQTWKCGIIIFCLSAACFWGCFSNEREKFPKEIKINANNFDIKSNNNQSTWCVVSASNQWMGFSPPTSQPIVCCGRYWEE